MQDAAILEVIELIERIDPAEQRDIHLRSIREGDVRRQLHQRLEFYYAADGYGLAALEPEIHPRHPLLEDEGKHTHADEVRAVNTFEALRDHGAHAEQARAFSGPV